MKPFARLLTGNKYSKSSIFSIHPIAFLFAAVSGLPAPASAQLTFQDFTSGTAGNPVTAAPVSWLTSGAGNGTFTIAAGVPLTYSCYNGGGGNYLAVNKATSATSNVGANFSHTTAANSTIYYSFLLNVSSASATSDYFAALSTSIVSPTYFARLYSQTTTGGYRLGIAAFTGVPSYKTASTVLSIGTTYLVVVRYDYFSGSANDMAYLWINPVLSAEPSTLAAEVSQLSGASEAPALVSNGAFTLRNNSSTPNYALDGIRVAYGNSSASAWSSLNASLAPASPVANAGSNAACTQVTANWSASANATGHLLDVSTATDFSSLLPGFNGLNVGNVTTYNIAGLTPGTTYYYRVRALNGSCESSPSAHVAYATLKAPEIIVQPVAPAATCEGGGVQTISVSALGDGLLYVWRKDGTPLSNNAVIGGQGTRILTLTNPTTSDAGSYDVEISGSCSPGVTSQPVNVSVRSLPSAAIGGNAAVCKGDASPPITFTGSNGTAPYTFTYSLNNGSTQTITTTAGNSVTLPVATTASGIFACTLLGVQDAVPNGCNNTAGGTATVVVTETPAPTISVNGATSFCAGGNVQLLSSATAGNQWYRDGQLLTGESGQSLSVGTGGSYTVVVTENYCPSAPSAAQEVIVFPAPTLGSASQATPVCDGSAAIIQLTGLVPNSTLTVHYTINGVTQLPVTGVVSNNTGAASFITALLTTANNGQMLQITALTTGSTLPNCTAQFAVDVPLAVTNSASAAIAYNGSPYCAAGAAIVTQTGIGSGVFSAAAGLVMNAATGEIDLNTSVPGTYIVTYSFGAGNCSGFTTASLVIKERAALQPAVTPVACHGGSSGAINLTVSGAVATAYQWVGPNNFSAITEDISGLSSGSYIVTVSTADGCSVVSTIAVTEPALLSLVLDSKTNTACHGGADGQMKVMAQGGTEPYQLALTGNITNTSGAASGIFTGLPAGTYTVSVTDNNGCTQVLTGIVVAEPAGTTADAMVSVANYTDNFFPTASSEVTLLFQVSEIGGNPALSTLLRITRQSGYTFSLPAMTSIVLTGASPGTYAIDNQRWSIDDSDPVFFKASLNSGQQLSCGQQVFLAVKLTRTNPSKGVFVLTAQLRNITGETQTHNNTTAILLIGQ